MGDAREKRRIKVKGENEYHISLVTINITEAASLHYKEFDKSIWLEDEH